MADRLLFWEDVPALDAVHEVGEDGRSGTVRVSFTIPQRPIPHHNADGSLRHYCTADYCPDLYGTEK